MQYFDSRCFKAYDVRGTVPEQLNEALVFEIGLAFVHLLRQRQAGPLNIVVGHDIRLSSPVLSKALCAGLTAAGADVLWLGLCGTEQVYFAVRNLQASGGVMVTASHNPANYNGLKFVSKDARPVSAESGLADMAGYLSADIALERGLRGHIVQVDNEHCYVEHLLSYIDCSNLRALRLVANAGNGGAGSVARQLLAATPCVVDAVLFDVDGTFPNGVPNPLLPENRDLTACRVREFGADFGVAWDGDFDRCFVFDERGEFIESYYLVALFAEYFLARYPEASIVHDLRLCWNTCDRVAKCGGEAVASKSGHSFMKETMRRVDAVYGGELAGHHYFRDFAYCDSGMIPMLLLLEILSTTDQSLSALVAEQAARFPCSGEINRRVLDPEGVLKKVGEFFNEEALRVDHLDGLSMEFEDWRFNLRSSNTEPTMRLNVESRGSLELMRQRRDELLMFLE